MSNAIVQLSRHFLRHRRRSSSREDKSKKRGVGTENAVEFPTSAEEQNNDLTGTYRDLEIAPSDGQNLAEEVDRRRKLLQRDFNAERMHRELLDLEAEKLHTARENHLLNRQFMAVLRERQHLDRERQEMIAAAVNVWKELSGEEENLNSEKEDGVHDTISKALLQPASFAKIKEEAPRLLKRLRMCKNESEVRKFQADVKRKQEVLFQLLLKSETMIATGVYYPHNKDQTPTNKTNNQEKQAVKRHRNQGNVTTECQQSSVKQTQSCDRETATDLQPIRSVDGSTSTNEDRATDQVTTGNERVRTRNVLTWNLGIKETAI